MTPDMIVFGDHYNVLLVNEDYGRPSRPSEIAVILRWQRPAVCLHGQSSTTLLPLLDLLPSFQTARPCCSVELLNLITIMHADVH